MKTLITSSMPHGLRRGDIVASNIGGTFVVREATAYTVILTPPRWYERLWWYVKARWAQLAAWCAWKRLERRIRSSR